MGGNVDLLERLCGAFNVVHLREAVHFHVRTRHSGDQALGVWVLWCAQNLLGLAVFYQIATVHHRNVVCEVCDHAHVVGDDDHGHVLLGAQALHQFQDLGLNGHVQRGCWLICDDNFRVCAKGEGDHHALAHTARKLVRVLRDAF